VSVNTANSYAIAPQPLSASVHPNKCFCSGIKCFCSGIKCSEISRIALVTMSQTAQC
jgi:hypothetical protein